MRRIAWHAGLLVVGFLLAFELPTRPLLALLHRALDPPPPYRHVEAVETGGAPEPERSLRLPQPRPTKPPRLAAARPASDLELVGVVVSKGVRRALLRAASELLLVAEGQRVRGFRVQAVGDESVRLVGRSGAVRLRLVWRASSKAASRALYRSPSELAVAPAPPVPPRRPADGFFRDGQDADVLLSGVGFDNSGGPLLYNHPGGIASDGERLFLSDRNNNRVLVWNHAPTENAAPDFVLGQPDFTRNDPGTGPHQMNWPSGVSAAGGRLVVADSNNHRILIWKAIPGASAAPADVVLKGEAIVWPWAVWTDGDRLAVTSTFHWEVLIWNHLPARGDQPPDVRLTARAATGNDCFGTPRTIVSDGHCLIVGDHNAGVAPPPGLNGCFVWQQFPTANQPFDYFMTEPGTDGYAFMNGAFPYPGELLLLGDNLHLWGGVPPTAQTPPSQTVDTHRFDSGDGRGVAVAYGRTYVCASNGNRVLVYDRLPAEQPSFALGSPDVDVNPLETHGIISNPNPATDGTHLFVASDFDRTLSIWSHLPERDNTLPDHVRKVGMAPNGIAVHGDRLALAGNNVLLLWDHLPLHGEDPSACLMGAGRVAFKKLRSVAMDDRYCYLLDADASAIYAWEGIPAPDREPSVVIHLGGRTSQRISSDGKYLAFGCSGRTDRESEILVLSVADLGTDVPPQVVRGFGGPPLPTPLLADGGLFVADNATSRVLAWRRTEDALDGRPPDAILGGNPVPAIGRNRLFCPTSLAFDGRHLWVGEFKFSERLLRFSLP